MTYKDISFDFGNLLILKNAFIFDFSNFFRH